MSEQPANPFNNNLPNQVSAIVDALDSRPRIVQCIQACNEERLIEACMLQAYDQVDKIIVIEGAVKNKVEAEQATPDGHSLDRTVEIIKEVKGDAEKNPDKKITFVQIDRPWENLEEIKNTFFQYMQDGDWMLITDADEFVAPETVDLLREAISREPWATEFVPTFYHFWKDRRYVRNPHKLGFGIQHQRFIKFQQGLNYVNHPVARDKNGICTYFHPQYLGRRFTLKGFDIFHYSYMNFKQKDILEKFSFYAKELSEMDGVTERGQIHDQFVNYTEKNEGDDDDDLFCANGLTHPPIVQSQPWFDDLDPKMDCAKRELERSDPYSLKPPQLILAFAAEAQRGVMARKGYEKLFNPVDV